MNTQFKKSIVFGCALATAFALSACGDDSSSSPNQENDNPSSSSISDGTDYGNGEGGKEGGHTPGGSSASNGGAGDNSEPLPAGFEDGLRLDFSLTVDEATKTISMTLADQANMTCVMEQEKIEWKSVPTDLLAETAKYDFVGDTLVLYNWDSYDQDLATEGPMYIGGTAGTLNGTWRSIPCYYDREKLKSECNNNLDESFGKLGIFSTNSLTVVEKTDIDKIDYANSKYRDVLLSALEDGRNWVPFVEELLFKSQNGGSFENIEEFNLTKTGETFTYKGTTYTVNVSKQIWDGINRVLAVEIASAEKTCTGLYESASFVTKKLCTQENYQHLDFDIFEDENGNTFRYADHYEKDNDTEYRKCLADLFDLEYEDLIEFAPLPKKAAKKHSKNRFKNLFR